MKRIYTGDPDLIRDMYEENRIEWEEIDPALQREILDSLRGKVIRQGYTTRARTLQRIADDSKRPKYPTPEKDRNAWDR